MTNIRIGNIEYRPNNGDEIIKWYPNTYYNAQERLLKEGYVKDSDGGMSKDNFHIHPSLFENEYSCYVITNLEWNSAHDEYDVRSVGTRAFELGPDNYHLLKIFEIINEEIKRSHD